MARTHGHGNPNWTRDEILLALDLYLDAGEKIPSGSDPRVVALSQLLRSLPYHSHASKVETFRNPAGVSFKLQNLRQVSRGLGLENASKMDQTVWDEFGSDQARVKEAANQIRSGVAYLLSLGETTANETPIEFREGRLLTEVHTRRERSRGLREELIKIRRAHQGELTCEICQRQSRAVPIDLGEAVFEVHHILPLSSRFEGPTRIEDVVLICANCHRLLHRAIAENKRWYSLNEARGLLGGQPLNDC